MGRWPRFKHATWGSEGAISWPSGPKQGSCSDVSAGSASAASAEPRKGTNVGEEHPTPVLQVEHRVDGSARKKAQIEIGLARVVASTPQQKTRWNPRTRMQARTRKQTLKQFLTLL